MTTLIDSCSEANYNTHAICRSAAYTSWGQSFTNLNSLVLDSCKFYLSKSGSPSGDITAKVYAHTGTYGSSSLPTGSVLASSGTVSANSLSTSNALITFTFSGANRITLSASTYYIVQLTCSGGDASNYVQVGICLDDTKHAGNSCRYWAGWYTFSQDVIFYVYGADLPTGPSIPVLMSSYRQRRN